MKLPAVPDVLELVITLGQTGPKSASRQPSPEEPSEAVWEDGASMRYVNTDESVPLATAEGSGGRYGRGSGGGSGGGTGRGRLLSNPDPADEGNLPQAPASRALRTTSVFGRGRPETALVRHGHLVDDDLSLLAMLRVRHDPERVWADLTPLNTESGRALAPHLIASHQEDPVGLLYDHLRTRLLQALGAKDWRRVAITAPSRGCGTSTVAANLALSLARRPSGRSVLMDMNFRRPGLAALFGAGAEAGALRDLLTASQPLESVLSRFGRSLALGLNGRAEPDAAELLQEPDTAAALRQLIEDLAPDVVLYDMPPLLENDDVLAFLPQVDGVLLVVDATRNTAAQVRECERLLQGRSEFLGVVMNRAEDSPVPRRRWWRR